MKLALRLLRGILGRRDVASPPPVGAPPCEPDHPGDLAAERPAATHFDFLFKRAMASVAAGTSSDAIADLEEIARWVNDAQIRYTLGTLRLAEGDLHGAELDFREALRINPQFADAANNLGNALLSQNRLAEAVEAFRQAVSVEPGNASARLNEAFALLQMGDLEAGFEAFDWRWQAAIGSRAPLSDIPLLRRIESVRNKQILVFAEQGLGDTFHFVRYVEVLRRRGADVFLVCPVALHSVLSSFVPSNRLLAPGSELPVRFDYQCPMLSLPLAGTGPVDFGADLVPYLTATPDMVDRLSLAGGGILSIGICWRGNPNHAKNAERSPGPEPFRDLIARFSSRGVHFYSLMCDHQGEFLAMGGRDLGHVLDEGTAPFLETAALIASVDLIISCDTAVAHLAGAMGARTWVVLPFSPDWRWMLDRTDCPWYPTMKLFRQPCAGDWQSAIEQVGTALESMMATALTH